MSDRLEGAIARNTGLADEMTRVVRELKSSEDEPLLFS